MVYVRVFGLSGEDVPANMESRGIAKKLKLTRRDLNKHQAGALVANFFTNQTAVGQIEPGASIGIGNRLDELVGQGVVGGIDELAIGRAGANLAARDVLKGLDRIQNMPGTCSQHKAHRSYRRSVKSLVPHWPSPW